MQPEGLRRDAPLRGERTSQEDSHVERVRERAPLEPLEPVEVHEEKLLREGEVLLEDAVSPEEPVRGRQKGLVVAEADRPKSLGPQRERRRVGRRGRRPELDGERVVEERLVERVDDLAFALQVEAKPGERELGAVDRFLLELGQRCASQDAQVEVEHRPRIAPLDRDRRRLLEAGGFHLDGPDRDRISGPEAARYSVDGRGRERRALRNRLPRLQAHLLGIEDELDDRHRGHGREKRGVENSEERFRDLGELVVDLEAHARREEREGLEKPFDVRVLALVRLELQAGRDLRVLVGELGPHLAKKAQLALVVLQEDRCASVALDREVAAPDLKRGVERDRLGDRIDAQPRLDLEAEGALEHGRVRDR